MFFMGKNNRKEIKLYKAALKHAKHWSENTDDFITTMFYIIIKQNFIQSFAHDYFSYFSKVKIT